MIKEIKKSYMRKSCQKTDNIAIKNLSLSLNKGEIFGILGNFKKIRLMTQLYYIDTTKLFFLNLRSKTIRKIHGS